jgi:hypothetical protein
VFKRGADDVATDMAPRCNAAEQGEIIGFRCAGSKDKLFGQNGE